jgi:hypothetical protein
MAPSSDGAYELLEDRIPVRSFSLRCVVSVLLTAAVGLSAHTSKNALAPAEPALEALGVSPLLYSVIYALTNLCGILLPMAWGFGYMKSPRLVLITVPLGTLVGQAVVAIGLAMHDDLVSGIMLVIGWLLVCVCRAGGEVVQHICLVQCLPNALTTGFVVLIFFTHLSYVLCNVLVPRILSMGSDDESSVLSMQVVMLIPGVISVLAACTLASIQKSVWKKAEDVRNQAPFACQICARSFVWSEWIPRACRWIIIWNGLAVGILHAFQSVTNAMSTSFGLSLREAGDLNARNMLVSLLVLPLAGIFGDTFSNLNEILIVVLSIASLLSGSALLLNTVFSVPTVVWEGALMVLQVVGTFAPVVSLALIPRYTKRIGEAFGVVDSLKSTFQCVIVLLIGALRQETGGFQTATFGVCVGFGVMSVVSGLFFWESRRPAAEQEQAVAAAVGA